MVRRPLRTAGLGGPRRAPRPPPPREPRLRERRPPRRSVRRLPGRRSGARGCSTSCRRTRAPASRPGPRGSRAAREALVIAARAWRREPDWAPWARAAAFDRECIEVRRGFQNGGRSAPNHRAAELLDEIVRLARAARSLPRGGELGDRLRLRLLPSLHELARRWAPGLADERAALTVGLPGVASLEAHHELPRRGAALARRPRIAAGVAARRRRGAAAALAATRVGPAWPSAASSARHGHRLTGRDLACPTWREAPDARRRARAPRRRHALGDPRPRRGACAAGRRDRAPRRSVGRGLGGLGAPRRSAPSSRSRSATTRSARTCGTTPTTSWRASADRSRARRDARRRRSARRRARIFFLDVGELVHAGRDRRHARRPASDDRARRAARRSTPNAHRPRCSTAAAPRRPRRAPHRRVTAARRRVRRARPLPSGRRGSCAAPPTSRASQPGDVLVARYTDPGWTPVLERAAGLVLEAGGQLSHGAIVARELGIPGARQRRRRDPRDPRRRSGRDRRGRGRLTISAAATRVIAPSGHATTQSRTPDSCRRAACTPSASVHEHLRCAKPPSAAKSASSMRRTSKTS